MNRFRYVWEGLVNRYASFTFSTTRFRARKDTPRSYRQVALFRVPSLTNDYNSGLFRVYRTKNGYAVGTYRDGCFYEQFATAEFSEEALKTLGLEMK